MTHWSVLLTSAVLGVIFTVGIVWVWVRDAHYNKHPEDWDN